MELNRKRAKFVYEAARLAAEAASAPIVPATYNTREPAFKKQFEEVITRQCSNQRCPSAEQLHENWVQSYRDMGWQYGSVYDAEAKTHPDMVPYAELGRLERDKDEVFMALCEIARWWIRE